MYILRIYWFFAFDRGNCNERRPSNSHTGKTHTQEVPLAVAFLHFAMAPPHARHSLGALGRPHIILILCIDEIPHERMHVELLEPASIAGLEISTIN